MSYLIAEKGGHEYRGSDYEEYRTDHHHYFFLYAFLADIHLYVYLQTGYHGHYPCYGLGEIDHF